MSLLARRSFFLLLLFAAAAHAGTVHLECRHEISSGLIWDWGGLLRKQGFTAMSGKEGDETVTVVIGEERAFLRGNLASAVLVRIGDYLMEPTSDGNITMWRYLAASGEVPPYLIQTVAVRAFGVPSATMSAWRCREIATK